MAEYAILKVREKTKKDTQRLAKKFEMNILEFTQSMCDYFTHTGLNPQDKQVLSPAEELKKLRNTVISFHRTQEKDYILPTFSKMELLIGRFMQYLDEEAPKIEGAKKKDFEVPDIEELREKETQKKEIPSGEKVSGKTESEELKDLKNEYERLELKHKTMMAHLDSILKKTENKSTGLSKMPVINMPMAEIEQIRKLFKKSV